MVPPRLYCAVLVVDMCRTVARPGTAGPADEPGEIPSVGGPPIILGGDGSPPRCSFGVPEPPRWRLMGPFPIRGRSLLVADQTDPISAPPADPHIFEPAPRALHVRPWAIAAAGGVVMIRGVSRDFQLNRGCRILRRLHHVQHRRVETIRLIQRRRYWAGMANGVGTPFGHRHRRSGGSGGGRAVRRTR